jgi:glycosyltransferase involved in cell wall biosynthesis
MLEVGRRARVIERETKANEALRACVLVPAFQAADSLAAVLTDLARALPEVPTFVIDDGSTDGTSEIARAHAPSVTLLRHASNLGKGAALLTGLRAAQAAGFSVALTVDADGQHPADEARRVLFADDDPRALVLGVRDLAGAGAPRKNQLSNAISNHFLSRFSKRTLRDTQCGLRRYPVAETLALGAHAQGYAFEAEALLFAARRGLPIVEVPVRVVYPPEDQRRTHFDSVRDPARIIVVVLRTLARLAGGA